VLGDCPSAGLRTGFGANHALSVANGSAPRNDRGMRLPFLRGKPSKEGASFLLCCTLVAEMRTLAFDRAHAEGSEDRRFFIDEIIVRETRCEKGSWKG